MKNPASTTETYPQLTIKGVGYVCLHLVYHVCIIRGVDSSCASVVIDSLLMDSGLMPDSLATGLNLSRKI